ncbi:LacI family DNA-binding transcriptional regulator [Xanthobacter sediminis]
MRSMKRKKQPSIVDVAREANVSVSTAGRVMRGSDYAVGIETQEKVKRAAEKVGYIPNMLARHLRGGEHAFIGVVVGNMGDPFYGEIAQAVTETANAKSLMAIVANMQRNPHMEVELCNKLWEHRVSGLILSGGGFDQLQCRSELIAIIERMRKAGVVVVSLAERDLPAPCFSVDNYSAGRLMAQHVIERGHRAIGIAAGPAHSLASQRRLTGSEAALAEAGLKAVIVRSDFGTNEGASALDRLLAADPGITAVLAAGDTLALGMMQRAQALGRRVPDDLSVVSIGDTPYARLASPRITTVDVGLPVCCAEAVTYLVDSLAGKTPVEGRIHRPRLVEGESVRRLPGSTTARRSRRPASASTPQS